MSNANRLPAPHPTANARSRTRSRHAVALAAANEQVAAREAWVKYIEHGY